MDEGIYSPEEIFEGFLYEQVRRGRREWPRDDRKLDRVLYEVAQENPEEMGAYEFLLKTFPYSETLHRVYWEFRKSGIITTNFTNQGPDTVVLNERALKEPSEDLKKLVIQICDRFEVSS